jgi:hypothetical protein
MRRTWRRSSSDCWASLTLTLPVMLFSAAPFCRVPDRAGASFFVLALFSGSAQDGAFIMLPFGLGTLPNLAGAAYVLARFRAWFGSPTGRTVAGFIVGGFAIYGIYRALFMTSALGQGAFCLPGVTI